MAIKFSMVTINPVHYGVKLNNPDFDNGPVINDLLMNGAALTLPPSGEIWIHTPIRVDLAPYISIKGFNAGTRSNSDTNPDPEFIHPGGGSKIVVANGCPSAFWAERKPWQPRLSSIELEDFLIMGFGGDRGQIGINIEQDNDAVRILGVSTINLDTGVQLVGADAATIRGCWLSEVRNSIRALGSSQQLKIEHNHIGAQPLGKGIYLENPNWANVVGNHVYPDGHTCIEAVGALDCQFVANNLQSYYTGAVIIKGSNNLFSGKIQALRANGNWVPDPVERDGLYGLIHIEGDDNHITASTVNSAQPGDHTRVLIASGNNNWVTTTKISGAESNRKVVINGACQGTRIAHSARPSEVDTGGSNTEVIW